MGAEHEDVAYSVAGASAEADPDVSDSQIPYYAHSATFTNGTANTESAVVTHYGH